MECIRNNTIFCKINGKLCNGCPFVEDKFSNRTCSIYGIFCRLFLSIHVVGM